MHVIDIVDVDINRDMIDRSHRIGKKFVREETEDSDNSEVTKNEDREVPAMSPTRYQQIIVRFTSWRASTLVCKNVRVPGTKSMVDCVQELRTLIIKSTILQKYQVMDRYRAMCFQMYGCFGMSIFS